MHMAAILTEAWHILRTHTRLSAMLCITAAAWSTMREVDWCMASDLLSSGASTRLSGSSRKGVGCHCDQAKETGLGGGSDHGGIGRPPLPQALYARDLRLLRGRVRQGAAGALARLRRHRHPMLAVPFVAACHRLLKHAVPGVMRAVPHARRTASRSSRTTARCALWMPATGASARWS